MSKPRLGTDEYVEAHPNRIAIYNGNYGDDGSKTSFHSAWPWHISQGYTMHSGSGFKTQQDATDWVREFLENAAQVSE